MAELIEMSAHVPAVSFNRDQIDLIKRTIARGCSDDELKVFLHQCQRTGLDPLTRQIYCMKIDGRMSIQTSIDGFRLVAERSGKYAGQIGPEWCGQDGVWTDVWLANEPPAAARVAVLRSDFKEPLFAVARFKSYSRSGNMWQRMPDLMIAKVAEALALRRAFPQELSGLYTADEMAQAGGADEPIDVTPSAEPSEPPVVTEEQKPAPRTRKPQQALGMVPDRPSDDPIIPPPMPPNKKEVAERFNALMAQIKTCGDPETLGRLVSDETYTEVCKGVFAIEAKEVAERIVQRLTDSAIKREEELSSPEYR